MRYQEFKSKFNVICEEDVSRLRNGGFVAGDFVRILPSVLKHPKLAGHGSQFFDTIKSMVTNKLPTKISVIKSDRAESSNGMVGSSDAPTGFWADVYQEPAPGLAWNVITLPIDVLEVVTPENNNWSPDFPEDWKYANKVNIHPEPVKLKDKEINDHSEGDKRNLPTSNNSDVFGKEPKDGRKQVKKPAKYKESNHPDDGELLAEAYEEMNQSIQKD